MSITLNEYVKYVMTIRGDINISVRAHEYTPQEIADARAKAEPNTEEFYILTLMAINNPQNTTTNDTTPTVGTKRTVGTNDSNS